MTTAASTLTASSATHLQLLLQQHHALQRKELETKERLEREKKQQLLQQLQQQQNDSSNPSTTSSSTLSSNLNADAKSVAAYMAAYLKAASTTPSADNNSADRAHTTSVAATATTSMLTPPASTIDSSKTTLALPLIVPHQPTSTPTFSSVSATTTAAQAAVVLAAATAAAAAAAAATPSPNPFPATVAPSSTLLYPASTSASSPTSTSTAQHTRITGSGPAASGATQLKPLKPITKKLTPAVPLDISTSFAASTVSTAATALIIGTSSENKSTNHRQECYNCGVTKTPLWRRTADRLHSLCNACGLYYKQYKTNRPLVAKASGKDESSLSSPSTATSLAHTVPSSQQLQKQLSDQQSKRRKISSDTGNSISTTSAATTPGKPDSSEKAFIHSTGEHPATTASNLVSIHTTTAPSHLKPLLPYPSTTLARQLALPPSPPSYSLTNTPSVSPPPLSSKAASTRYKSEDSENEGDEEDEDDDDDDGYRDNGDDREDTANDDYDMEGRGLTLPDVEMCETSQDVSDDHGYSDSSEDTRSQRQQRKQEGQQQFHQQKQQAQHHRQQKQQKRQQQQHTGTSNLNGVTIECANCGQTETPLWRKDSKGQSICNACGLYARLHQRDRPVTMRKSNIARRKRDWVAIHEKKADATAAAIAASSTQTAEAEVASSFHDQSQDQGIDGEESLSGGVKTKAKQAHGQLHRSPAVTNKKRKVKIFRKDAIDNGDGDVDSNDSSDEDMDEQHLQEAHEGNNDDKDREGLEEDMAVRVEVLAMNIPVSNEDESDHTADEHMPHQMPTPISNASLSPLMTNSANSANNGGSSNHNHFNPANMAAFVNGAGSLSPASLTASPPTPVLTSPNFLATLSGNNPGQPLATSAAAVFANLNPLLVQQYRQQLQNQTVGLTAAALAANASQAGLKTGTLTPSGSTVTDLSSTLLGNNVKRNGTFTPGLYPQYPSTPFLHESSLPQDPMSLAGLQLQQQQQQQAAAAASIRSPFTPAASSSPSASTAVASGQTFVTQSQTPQQISSGSATPTLANAATATTATNTTSPDSNTLQPNATQRLQPSTSSSTAPKINPLILDSTRFTRLINQMSKPQLSMFLTILEERCGALRHRLAGEDDSPHRVDQNEMLLMFNHPTFGINAMSHMDGPAGFSGGGIGIGASSSAGYYGGGGAGSGLYGGGYGSAYGGGNGATALTNLMALNDMGQHRERTGHLRTLSNASSDYMTQ
ncbi:putative electron transfer flavoprotein subunit [Linnemannia zychae]|nr:putative electron transfer flavoprotein subunit [Linnemannia zychae]